MEFYYNMTSNNLTDITAVGVPGSSTEGEICTRVNQT